MSSLAISVDSLSKKYRLGRAERYYLLRDLLSNTLSFPFRFLSALRTDNANAPFFPRRTKEEIWALKDISFDINAGEVVGIIGRNGAGKSTLLKVLSRITLPTNGHADIYGRVGSLLEVGTGFHPELTGRENIFLNGAILGMTRDEINRKLEEIIAFAEIERFMETPVKRYSSGMYVRLAFSVAAHLEPEILLVDEVLAVGDLKFQAKSLDKMQNVSQSGRTVLFVSHNMGVINRLCDRTILLDQGRILADGPTGEVIEKYISEAFSANAVYEQPHDPEKPINLRKAAIQNESGEVGSELPYDEAFSVVIDYEVNQPVSGCYVGFALLTATGINVLFTADHDTNIMMLKDRQPGNYRTTVQMPSHWFNSGQYTVRIFIADGFRAIAYDRIDALVFTIVDTGTPGSHLGSDSRRSVLQPQFDWATERLPGSP